MSTAAASICYWSWTELRAWAQSVSAAGQGDLGAGFLESLLASFVGGLVSMPLLLWVGMRLLGERRNHVLVLGGVVTWWLIGGHVVEDGTGSGAGTFFFLALFVALSSLLSLVGFTMSESRAGASRD